LLTTTNNTDELNARDNGANRDTPSLHQVDWGAYPQRLSGGWRATTDAQESALTSLRESDYQLTVQLDRANYGQREPHPLTADLASPNSTTKRTASRRQEPKLKLRIIQPKAPNAALRGSGTIEHQETR
jgi:hypothetical protein